MKQKIIEILKEYSCWTPKEHYGCIPKLANQILELIKEDKIQEYRNWISLTDVIQKILPELRKEEKKWRNEALGIIDFCSYLEHKYEKSLPKKKKPPKKKKT